MSILFHCWWQILVAAVAYFALGALWYSPAVFGNIWANGHGIVRDPSKVKPTALRNLMIVSFILSFLLSWIICWLSCATGCGGMFEGIWHVLRVGMVIGFAISAAISIGYLYQGKPAVLYFVDCGYHLVGCKICAVLFYVLGCC